MGLRCQPTLAFPVLVGLATLVSTFAMAQDVAAPTALIGDPERGKTVYQKIGGCANCHGWAGDGGAGRNPLARTTGANLRVTELDPEGLAETIKCGRPGTQMPFHDSAAYRDGRCYGLVMSDFEPGQAPLRGKTFREKQLADLLAYMQAHMVGLGKPTIEECRDYYGASAEKACAYLKSQ